MLLCNIVDGISSTSKDGATRELSLLAEGSVKISEGILRVPARHRAHGLRVHQNEVNAHPNQVTFMVRIDIALT